MRDVFTEYVAALAQEEEPDPALYDEVLEHLLALLVTEMRRRGLWTAPPAWLGVTSARWQEVGALEELTFDAYVFAILRRLRGLTDQLEVRENIRGLVVKNVRHFLTKRQRDADPIGYRVFSRLRRALLALVERGQLVVRGWVESLRAAGRRPEDEGLPKLRNASVMGFGPFQAALASPDDLAEPVARIDDALMPDLVTAEGAAVQGVVNRLADRVATLPEDGVRAFRVGHLAKVMKDDVRSRWWAVWGQLQDTLPENGEPGAPQVPVARPAPEEDLPGFQDAVLRCVERTIDAVPQPKRRRDLWTVWTFLRGIRVDADAPEPMPSYSEAGRQVGLPRERVSQLLGELKGWVRRCFAGDGSAPAPSTPKSKKSSADGQGAVAGEVTR
ncbi:MAG: hypothetical protein AAGN66_27825 [Acidobacteriota bacterium]